MKKFIISMLVLVVAIPSYVLIFALWTYMHLTYPVYKRVSKWYPEPYELFNRFDKMMYKLYRNLW